MRFIADDGGRKAAGFKGDVGDCGCRAAAIALNRPYREVYDRINAMARRQRRHRDSARNGVGSDLMRRLMESYGWEWVPTMRIGSGCTVHMVEEELPRGAIVVSLSHHYSAVVDGVCRDTYDPSRDGTRCVYGYFRFPLANHSPVPWTLRKGHGRKDHDHVLDADGSEVATVPGNHHDAALIVAAVNALVVPRES